ncbi:Rossmann-like and DUF2520 domain-containing protein [Pontimicrobium aquaticum]|uniref:DUF2520 domain-containing protein n=1 Tax=Pontimicrobium aquaticum TaxID=2565367 RepID=A0A4U0EV98_9FLAO|nr:Rossmann-like and DUF2520 domain-containing protein [Pontimicrobium aquaticum]TJY35821.1 DUF2520 domain-containing protein [Pontimicrobium aquaticum]
MISVTLIGAGNVATHLYKALKRAKDTTVIQWYSRNMSSISSFKNEVEITNDINSLKTADVYIIAVSDSAISTLSSQLPFSNELVVHTSGSVSLHDLDKKHHRGVFYPLQTFTKGADLNFTEVPICIEVENKVHLQTLKNLSEALGCKHYRVNSDQRAALHLAAVFVNNFTNQLYRVAHEITESKSVDFNILKPLIKETASKIDTLSPYMAQTGPAVRNDNKTIKKHLKSLDKDIHKQIYELLTKSIKLTHGKKL